MPCVCVVPCCKSNTKGQPYTTAFSFPKDPEMKKMWEKKIHRKDFVASRYSVVCIKHFDERFIVRESRVTRDDGSVLIVPLKNIQLTKDAYPTIFEGQPSYLTTKLPPNRKKPANRSLTRQSEINEASINEEKIRERNESIQRYREWCEKDKIKSFEDFKTGFPFRLPEDWIVINTKKDLFFGKPDLSNTPKFEISIRIDTNLVMTVWHNESILKPRHLEMGELRYNLWSKFDSLLRDLEKYSRDCLSNAKLDLTLKQYKIELMNDIDQCGDAYNVSAETLKNLKVGLRFRLPEKWIVISTKKNLNLFFGKADLSDCPKFQISAKINTNLVMTVWNNGSILKPRHLGWSEPSSNLLSKFESLIKNLDKYYSSECLSNEELDFTLNQLMFELTNSDA